MTNHPDAVNALAGGQTVRLPEVGPRGKLGFPRVRGGEGGILTRDGPFGPYAISSRAP